VLLTDPAYVGLINRVRLAGGVPRYLPLRAGGDGWRLDLDALAAMDPRGVRLALMMSPSMPSGGVLDSEEWQAIAAFCEAADCWLLNDAAMERLLFDGRAPLHPASLPGMRGRVVTVGSASKEYRMIGWRVGWVVGPAKIIADVARVSLGNVVCQTGIAMTAVTRAITAPDDGIEACTRELERRRDLILNELDGYRVIRPHGGWSMLVDVTGLGIDAVEASRRLLEHGRIAATPMVNWGSNRSAGYLRLVFSNENCERLADIRRRFDTALRH